MMPREVPGPQPGAVEVVEPLQNGQAIAAFGGSGKSQQLAWLQVRQQESEALLEDMQPFFQSEGHELPAMAADRWLARRPALEMPCAWRLYTSDASDTPTPLVRPCHAA